MSKISKLGKAIPHYLNKRQVQIQKIICDKLLQQPERKSLLHWIVTDDEKWIYFEHPK